MTEPRMERRSGPSAPAVLPAAPFEDGAAGRVDPRHGAEVERRVSAARPPTASEPAGPTDPEILPSPSSPLPSPGGKIARKVAVAVIGMTVLVFGVALIVLPGPAILVIPLGLTILATEFVWARNLQIPLRRHLRDLRLRAGRILGRPGR